MLFWFHHIHVFHLAIWIASAKIATPNQNLLKELLAVDYDADIRPTPYKDYVTAVTVVPNLFILLELDQQRETLTFREEFLLTWEDPYLGWDRQKTNYSKDWIKVPESKVWVPDVIFNYALKMEEHLGDTERFIDMKYDGTIRQSNPSVTEIPCALKIEDFPYDTQICKISLGKFTVKYSELGSWNFNINQLIVKMYSNETIFPMERRFEGNSEWELISINCKEKTSLDINFSEAAYSYLEFYVTLKRKPVYYVLVIQAPTFILATLTIFGLFTPFCQDNERREKVTLGLNMFVSISIMLNLVSDMMPKASRLPLLGNYILAEIFVCGIGVIVSIIIHTIHQRCHTRSFGIPNWIKRIALCSRQMDSSTKEKDELGIITKNKQNDEIIRAIATAIDQVSEEIKLLTTSAERQNEWTRIFDRVDLLMLGLFQSLNVIVSIIFMR